MNFGNRKSYGFYFGTEERQSKQSALLPRKILSSVAAFVNSAEINHCRSSLLLMLASSRSKQIVRIPSLSVPQNSKSQRGCPVAGAKTADKVLGL